MTLVSLMNWTRICSLAETLRDPAHSAPNSVISIISHGHQDLIQQGGLLDVVEPNRIIVRENIPSASKLLEDLKGYVQNLRCLGFGANQNRNFEIAGLGEDDWYVICNPDIRIPSGALATLLANAERDDARIAVPMLWNSREEQFDHNVRPFPKLIDLALSFFGHRHAGRYLDDQIEALKHPDWASGAMMAVKASAFRKLGGFDERFFMYMEDVDLCRRARRIGIGIHFYPDVIIIHDASRENRKIFSPNFRFHIRSILQYFLSK